MKKLKLTKNFIIIGILLVFAMNIGTIQGYCKAANTNNAEQAVGVNDNIEQYIAQTRRKIKNNWYPPTASLGNSATIVLTIDREGHLLDCRLSNPSPDEGFNESLIKAAKKAAYSPLPDELPYKNVDIDLDFSMEKKHISK